MVSNSAFGTEVCGITGLRWKNSPLGTKCPSLPSRRMGIPRFTTLLYFYQIEQIGDSRQCICIFNSLDVT